MQEDIVVLNLNNIQLGKGDCQIIISRGTLELLFELFVPHVLPYFFF